MTGSLAASEESRRHLETICKLGLKSKILTHTRCHMDDARIAVETGKLFSLSKQGLSVKGVDGVDVVIGTSSILREFSHGNHIHFFFEGRIGKDMKEIAARATEVVQFVKSKGLEVRFSSEDSFRSNLVDLLSLYREMDQLGVDRVGIADTVGCADPMQVYQLVILSVKDLKCKR